MTSAIHLIHAQGQSLELALERSLSTRAVKSLGVAVAYVSVYGARFLRNLVSCSGIDEVWLITDIRDGVTHPSALQMALDEGWSVRVVSRNTTFHPKLYVGGKKIRRNGEIEVPTMFAIGSSNLTRNGLGQNVECCLLRVSDTEIRGVGPTFKRLWSFGIDLDAAGLSAYESYFADRNRARSPRDLEALGVNDVPLSSNVRASGRPTPSVTTRVANSAWTGLESSTGEYRYQIEFPRSAGEVLQRIVQGIQVGNIVDILCEDAVVRQMTFRYYPDNSMFRLNVQNEVPGVALAKQAKTGIGLIEKLTAGPASIRLRIVHDKIEKADIRSRSVALGTYGLTSTRMYGWY